jgi:DNA-binding LytR/AlgR family response regulator
MGDMNGVNVGKIIREERHDYSTAIVYISATQEYTMELFQNQPLDFIMKPATYEEISKLLLRYLDIQKRQNHLFSYQYGTDLRVLPISEIVYFESQGRRIRIVMLQGETQCYYTMKKLVKEYNLADFVRCHNSYFVNINYVKEVSANHMKLVNEEKIPISQARKSQVFEKLKNWNHSEI